MNRVDLGDTPAQAFGLAVTVSLSGVKDIEERVRPHGYGK